MSMRISKLHVQDFKRVKLVDVDIDGSVITIGGKNAAGKSSVLDAIWNALAGKQKSVERPIRDGEKRATIEVTIENPEGGGYIVTRSYTGKGSTIKVVPLENPTAQLSKPQSVLDGLIGKFAFDPLEFAMQDKKAQLKTLLELVELDFDLDEVTRERAEAYEERTHANRDKKRAEGALATLGARPVVEGEAMSLVALADELQVAERENHHLTYTRDAYKRHLDAIEVKKEQLAELEAEASDLLERGKGYAASVAALRDVEAIRADMSGAEENNFNVVEQERWDAASAEYIETTKESDLLTELIKDLDRTKNEGLARAQFPIEGLAFDEEGVIYQGVPFSQASAAEKIRVSVAMAMAMNPELKVICVKDATLLDEDNQKLLRTLAEEAGYQVFLEMVGQSTDWSFVLEDGEVL